MNLRRDDIDLYYETRGQGPAVVLLPPYPSDHRFWLPVAELLAAQFRLVLPDLRGLGRSDVGQGPTSMAVLAEDLAALLDALNIGQATLVGCSVGGYVLFEFWRRWRERVQALVLVDTKAGLDSDEARRGRLHNADELLERGPQWAIEQMLPRLLAPDNFAQRPDLVQQARQTMNESRAPGMAALQRGMAARIDSSETLATITAPTLVLGGEHDIPSPLGELEKMARGIRGAELKIIPQAGHYAALEAPQSVARLMGEFLARHVH